MSRRTHLSGDGDLNLNTGLDVDDDLLDDLGGGVQVDQALVDPVCRIFVSKCSLCARSLSISSRDLNPASPVHRKNSPHLVGVPGLGALTARGLAGGDLEVLGGHADGALDAEVLGLRAVDELLAHLLQRRDLARGQGDADLVDLGHVALLGLLGVVGGHFGGLRDGMCDRDCRGERVSLIARRVFSRTAGCSGRTSVGVLDSVT